MTDCNAQRPRAHRDSEILERWRQIAGEIDPESADPDLWAEGPVSHLFHLFRPDGTRLAELFEGLPKMAPVVDRLRLVFECAGPETGHMYFIVSRPRRLDVGEVKRNVQMWINNVGSMVKALGMPIEKSIQKLLTKRQLPVEVARIAPFAENEGDVHPMESAIYQAVTEVGHSMIVENDVAALLVEPLYMMTCSYTLAYWVLSPLGPKPQWDPFAPAASLWQAGLSLYFEGMGSNFRIVAAP